ncbi:hypothetical protein [Nitrobacter sp.]|uniref:hypothetical protein n=1 Tax=Nitrobacter sp. TaxID=29420 RepID=UPI0029CAAE6B|nr:hypothetical protein [Nitrobacter sp.]
MSWQPTLYPRWSDEATGKAALLAALDTAALRDGSVPPIGDGFACVAPMPPVWDIEPIYADDGTIAVPGTPLAGWGAMVRLDDQASGYAAALAALMPVAVPKRPGWPDFAEAE